MKNLIWLLGAMDPEMECIWKFLLALGEQVIFATKNGRRVTSGEAYEADPIDAFSTGALYEAILVECRALVFDSFDSSGRGVPTTLIDHHNPGDPGYGRDPSEFWTASSLGQVVEALRERDQLPAGWEIPHEFRLAAAADHCLGHAYAGRCPGVIPEDLWRWRLASRAAFQKRSVDALIEDAKSSMFKINTAKWLNLSPVVAVRDLRGQACPELPEAQARSGVSVLCDGMPGHDRRQKINCMGDREACAAFFPWAAKNGVIDTYGDPARGIVGGYLAARQVEPIN